MRDMVKILFKMVKILCERAICNMRGLNVVLDIVKYHTGYPIERYVGWTEKSYFMIFKIRRVSPFYKLV